MDLPILIGDIGSTKSSWWYGTDVPNELHLNGYNPMAHPRERGYELFKTLKAATGELSFSTIWYYGAGVLDNEIELSIKKSLSTFFPESEIHVHADLVGASFAASGHSPGTIAILGTGSHAAVWNGDKIIRQAISLGYILGDEGGGCDIGKALIQAYFYKEMPAHLWDAMEERLPAGRKGLLTSLGSSPVPNQYLADYARVAVLFQEDSWIMALISARFHLFVNRHILPLRPNSEIHIVGSIGCIFASLIRKELDKAGLKAGTFIKDPSLRLYEQHQSIWKKEKRK